MDDEDPKIELCAQGDAVEIRYFDAPKDGLYRSWKLPISIADDLIAWRQKMGKQKDTAFPLKTRTKACELTMNTDKHIEIKSLDCHGRTNMAGWSLPAAAVECLSMRQKIAK